MNPSDPTLQQLRRQRNVAAAIAVGVLLTGFATALPKSLVRYRTLRTTQNELVGLQAQITHLQNQIVESQKQLGDVQRQILAAQKK